MEEINSIDNYHKELLSRIDNRADNRGIVQVVRNLQSHGFGGYGVLIEDLWILLNDSVKEFESLRKLYQIKNLDSIEEN